MTEHPATDSLLDYIENPQAQNFTELRYHLLGCAYCRDKVHVYSSISNLLPSLAVSLPQASEQLPDSLVELLNNNTAKDAQLAAIFSDKPELIRTALSYLSNKKQMNHGESVQLESNFIEPKQKNSFELFHRLLNFKFPVWLNIPISATAILIFVIVLNSSNTQLSNGKSFVASYQDTDHAMLSDAKQSIPGRGFFNQTKTESIPFANVNISLNSENQLNFSWQKIPEVKNYALEILAPGYDGNKTLVKTESKVEKVTINNLTLSNNRRYL